jgi:hypothetical protein
MKFGDFYGHKTAVLENKFFRIECLAEAGPRIVRLIPAWTGENLFAELPHFTTKTASGEYHYFGGHRFWYTTESLSHSYYSDLNGLSIKPVTKGLRLFGGKERTTGLQKTVTVQISSSSPYIIVRHKLENHGRRRVRLAPWAITMMRTKGVAILPQQLGNIDADGLRPNRVFALWPYTRWDDPRLHLGDEFVLIHSDSTDHAIRLGYFNPHGWLGYVQQDVLFLKRYGVRSDEEYPDDGCNSKVHANFRAVELGSLGPLVELAPAQQVVHTETWEVYKGATVPKEILSGRSLQELLDQWVRD